VQQIFTEAGGKALKGAIEVAQETVAEVGSLEPAALLPAIKRWLNELFGSDDPYFHGEFCERVALFADFAVWIPWGLS
jgi:hypothetical protein